MEKITSGLPPLNLPLHSPYLHLSSPPISQTLISQFHPNFTIDPFYCLLLLYLFSAIITLSLSIIYLTLPLLLSFKGFSFFSLAAIDGVSISVLFTRCISHSILLGCSDFMRVVFANI